MDETVARLLKITDLVGGSIGCFFTCFQILLARQAPAPRTREMLVAALSLLLSVSALLWWANDELGFRPVLKLMGPLQLILAMAYCGVMKGIPSRPALAGLGLLLAFYVVVDFAGIAPFAFTVEPHTRRTPVVGALVHVLPVLALLLWTTSRAVVAMQAGDRELRLFVVGCVPIIALYVVQIFGVVGLIGIVRVPTGAMALALAVVTTWWQFDRTASHARTSATPSLELGGYRLLERIGHGGMAEVFLGERSGPGGFKKQVAIKRMLPALTDEEDFREMFLDEARLAARLSHENIVPIHELGIDKGTYFLIMEYLPGLALSQLRRRGIIVDPDVVVAVGAQVCAGLAYAHELRGDDGKPLGLVHRDISPQNLMIDERGNLRILDFGIARAAGRTTKTETGAIKGKVPYMAPEQLDGTVDARTDVYAVGVVLCELACGHRPLEGDDLSSLAALMRREVPLPARFAAVPTPLRQVIARALDADPAKRFPTATALRTALLAALPQLPGPHTDLERAKVRLGQRVGQALLLRSSPALTPVTLPRKVEDVATFVEQNRATLTDRGS
ncbi:MAG: serine/threonine-protein kinase [Deltaproteobacteria bacterium]|nr:serine/threonine-protein kinase [Deltaproteobacteria bacterium]